MRIKRQRDDRGAAAVEFALVMIPLVVILFGLVQYGLYFYAAQTGSNTANAAVRQLSVGNCQTQNKFQSYVDGQLGAASTGSATLVQVWTRPDGTTATGPTDTGVLGGTVKLTLSFPSMNMHFPLVPFLSDATVTRQVQARVEDTTDQNPGSCS